MVIPLLANQDLTPMLHHPQLVLTDLNNVHQKIAKIETRNRLTCVTTGPITRKTANSKWGHSSKACMGDPSPVGQILCFMKGRGPKTEGT